MVAINDLGPVATNAHLFKYDGVHGRFPSEITMGDNWIDISRGRIAVSAERDPT
ncbi:glyceraldehyde 3-phosphate dehydrogenase NAD-binding domain-containing protein [Bradyrhizobium cenepequi]